MSGVHLSQIKSYEAGSTKPTTDALTNLTVALHVSADRLLFDEGERDPPDEFKLAFEALSEFEPAERAIIERMLRGLILQKQIGTPD